jgi:hypothetical protein
LGIRPEDVILGGRPETSGLALQGVVTKATFAGREAYYGVEVSGGPSLIAYQYRPHERLLAATGERVTLILPLDRLHAFATDDERRIELRP